VNEATAWRLELAQEIAAAYAANENAEVVMVAGSVGRGSADRFSDLELDVYYARAPTERERIAAVERCGGAVELLVEDEVEWEDRIVFGDFHAHTSTFLVATMERYLHEVVDLCLLAPDAQTQLFSLQHGIPVKGEAQIESWRAKAAAYPDGLQRAMLERNLDFERFAYGAQMLAARDDALALYELSVETGRRLLGVLLALNRIYLPTPRYLKSMDETVGLMKIAPPDLSARLKRSFRIEPNAAVATLVALIEETLALVETHVPGFDSSSARLVLARRRTGYDRPPLRPASV
jgi:hypothetical protein